MKALIRLPEQSFKVSVKREPSRSERWPWTVYVDGEVVGQQSSADAAKWSAKNYVKATIQARMDTAVSLGLDSAK